MESPRKFLIVWLSLPVFLEVVVSILMQDVLSKELSPNLSV
jgi:hypothetical protein